MLEKSIRSSNENGTLIGDEKLDEELALLRAIISNFPNAYVFVIKKDMTVGFTCGGGISKLGLDPTSYMGMRIVDVFGDSASFVAGQYERAFSGETVEFELSIGEQHQWFQVIPLSSVQGKVVGILSVAQNITPRKKMEIEHRQSRDRYQRLVDNLPAGVLSLDGNGRFAYANDAVCELLGYTKDEILSLHILDTYPEAERATAQQRLGNLGAGKTIQFERAMRKRDGTTVLIEAVAWKTEDGHLHAVVMDISRRKQTEEVLLRTQKLESLSALAGGIAHDFNNLFGAIFGNVDLAMDSTDDPEVHKYLERAASAYARAKSLTGQLLTFSKGGAPITQKTTIHPLVERAVAFSLSGSNVACEFNLDEALWPCHLDKDQFTQVVDNLVINAKQAMQSGGVLRVTVQNVDLHDNDAVNLPSGPYVRLVFTDEGIGIPRDIIHRIFDPFFSTKPGGHGLGLATCHSIIQRHGGLIQVSSVLHQGTTFTIHLPACAEETTAQAVVTNAAGYRGSGKFLVMDDDGMILELLRTILTEVGHEVLTTTTGEEAVSCFRQNQAAIAGVILDLTVKGGSGGREAITEIRDMATDVPAFVASGYADDPVMRNPNQFGFTASVNKPFRRSELVSLLEKYMSL